jgi:molecular chaperone GrpE
MKLYKNKKSEDKDISEPVIKDSRQIALEKAGEIAAQEVKEAVKEGEKEPEGPGKIKEKANLADNYYDQLLRLRAEFDNYRKRINKEREDYQWTLKEEIIYNFLPIVDNFERALKVAEESKDFTQLLEGIKMVHRQINDFFKDHGVTPILSEGKPFDPHTSEAIAQEESELPEHTVLEEMQKGYFLNDRVLRTAKVKVAVPRAADKKEEEIENG